MKIPVRLGERSYDILFGDAASGPARAVLDARLAGRGFMLVTDRNVARATGFLAGAEHKVILPPGEKHKRLDAVEKLCNAAADYGLDRSGVIVALGGGVVGDLAGFAAAVYMRGIGVIQVPTSLLAMVDSSVGGKTGADLAAGKNLVGAFHQPELVLIDPAFLHTLPASELANGMAEVIKYAVLFDAELFEEIRFKCDALKAAKAGAFLPVIRRCCELKAEIVSEDEREHGRRALLNYGHTFGHAVELLTGFRVGHGAAVAIGMCAAGALSLRAGLWSAEDAGRQKALLAAFDLPTEIPKELTAEAMLRTMRRDKKALNGNLNLILPCGIGRAEICRDVPEAEIAQAIEAAR